MSLLLGVVGHLGSGKDTLSNILSQNHGFIHVSASVVLRQHLPEGVEESRSQLVKVGNELRTCYGGDYLVKVAHKLGEKADLVISGIYSQSEVDYIRMNGGLVLAVVASQTTRYKRLKLRKRFSDNLSFQDFLVSEEIESCGNNNNEQSVQKLIDTSDFRFDNESSDKRELERQIQDFLFHQRRGTNVQD